MPETTKAQNRHPRVCRQILLGSKLEEMLLGDPTVINIELSLFTLGRRLWPNFPIHLSRRPIPIEYL